MLQFLRNFPGGMTVGIVCMCLIASVIDFKFGDSTEKYFLAAITISITAFAASLAVFAQLKVLQQTKEISEEDRERRLLAAKLDLPLALSEISTCCRIAIKLCFKERKQYRKNPITPEAADIAFSDYTKDTLRRIISDARPEDGEHLAGIIRHYQILISRWNGKNVRPEGALDMGKSSEELAREMAYYGYLDALAATAFNYARGSSHITEVMTVEDILRWIRTDMLDNDFGLDVPSEDWIGELNSAAELYLRMQNSGNWLLR
ncbi:MAG: hypothetical protein ACPG5U_02645 [Planktomarina sp.]